MCITTEQLNKLLDERDVRLKENELLLKEELYNKIQESIKAQLAHNTTAPETELRLKDLQEQIKKHDSEEKAHWETIRLMHTDVQELKKSITENTEATGAVRDLLAGGRILRAFAQFLSWTGIIIASFFAIYHFLRK